MPHPPHRLRIRQNISSHYHLGETGIAEAIAQAKETRFRIHLRLRAQAEHSYYRALAALDRTTVTATADDSTGVVSPASQKAVCG